MIDTFMINQAVTHPNTQFMRKYYNNILSKINYIQVKKHSSKIAHQLKITASSSHFLYATKQLQHALNQLNTNNSEYVQIKIDGIIEAQTLQSLRECIKNNHENQIIRMLK